MTPLWIMIILIVVTNSSQADISEDKVGSRDLHKASSNLHVAAVQVSMQDGDNSPLTSKVPVEEGQSLTRRINSRSKIKIKSQFNIRKSPSFVMSTRRPLMKIRIYTAKPHIVYNDQWLRFREHNNFGSKKTLRTRIQFKSKNRSTHRNKKIVISAKNPPNHFKNIDMTEEDDSIKRRNENSRTKTRRIAAAASEVQPIIVRKENIKSKAESVITKENITKTETTDNTVLGKHNTTEVTTDKNVKTPDETAEREVTFTKDKNSISTSTLKTINDEPTVTTTDSSDVAQTSETRSKRSVNIIEEEGVATTSTGFKFTGHDMGAEFNYNNIHT